MSEAPRITGFDHTGLAVRSIQAALPLYRDALGGVEIARGHSPWVGLRWVQLRYPNGGVLELVEPDGPGGLLRKFLNRRGEGVHHLTFTAAGIEAAAAELKRLGYRVVDEDYSRAAWKTAYVSPLSAHGTIIQLGEGEEEVPPERNIPDAIRERARRLIQAAPPAERAGLARFAAALGLLDTPAEATGT